MAYRQTCLSGPIILATIGKIPMSKWVNAAVTNGMNLILLRLTGITLELIPIASGASGLQGGPDSQGAMGFFVSSYSPEYARTSFAWG